MELDQVKVEKFARDKEIKKQLEEKRQQEKDEEIQRKLKGEPFIFKLDSRLQKHNHHSKCSHESFDGQADMVMNLPSQNFSGHVDTVMIESSQNKTRNHDIP